MKNQHWRLQIKSIYRMLEIFGHICYVILRLVLFRFVCFIASKKFLPFDTRSHSRLQES